VGGFLPQPTESNVAGPTLFDAVVFDLDGTLIATDRFWVQAARVGARRAFDELRIDVELPSTADWMSLVGRPLDQGFVDLFPGLKPEQRRRVQAECVLEEHRLLERGAAALMPGAIELLRSLRERGLRLGVASNCSQAYLEHMLGPALLGPWIDAARCLDSPGVATKADMLAQILESLDTRSAMFVGDRLGDRDAAWANGMPYVQCAFGFSTPAEKFESEARISDLAELEAWIDRRSSSLAAVLQDVASLARRGGLVVGITGPIASGKSLLARDAARSLASSGVPSVVLTLEEVRRASPIDDRDPLTRRYDVDALEHHVLAPRGMGSDVELTLEDGRRLAIPHAAVLLLEGPFLLDPRLAARIDRLVYVAAGDEVVLRRIAARTPHSERARALGAARSEVLPAQRALESHYDPRRIADVWLDGGDPFTLGCDRRA
jgi:phosphoglycolate phosphatase